MPLEELYFLMLVLQLSLGHTCLAGVTELTLESNISLSLRLFELKTCFTGVDGRIFFWNCLKQSPHTPVASLES